MPTTLASHLAQGDDLDDGLDLDSGLLAHSDAEEELDVDVEGQGDGPGEAGEASGAVYEEEDDGSPRPEKNGAGKGAGKKRKERDGEGQTRSVKKMRQEIDPAPLSAEELGDFFNQSLRQTYSKASEMELADLRLPAAAVLSTANYSEPRDLDHYADFVRTQLPALPKKLRKPGTPSIVILASSGQRCADIVRALKRMEPKPAGEIGKLFAKHFKVPEQVEYLRKTKVVIAVGTPGRIGRLIKEDDALHIRQQTIILLDTSFRDSKNRTVLTIHEVRDELWRTFLGDKDVRERLLQPGVRFAVY